MEEKNINIVLNALAETIERLRLDNRILKIENDRLKEQIAKEGEKNA